MFLYRISNDRYAKDLSGFGAEKYGGRWNLKGVPVLYTADAMSLCALEALIHAGEGVGPVSRVMITYQFPDDITKYIPEDSSLPDDWDDLPPTDGGPSSQFGQQWIERGEELVMAVPSVVMPLGKERSVIINVRHPDFNKLDIIDIQPFSFDPRLTP